MIFGKDGFVRTRPYGRSRICLKARKYRRFGGLKRNHLWLRINIYNDTQEAVGVSDERTNYTTETNESQRFYAD